MPKLKKKSDAQKLSEARRRREADTEARRLARQDPQRREIERAADAEARRIARKDEERRKFEQAANTKRRRVAREDTERRKVEQAANTEARRIAREDQERRKVERAADKEARRVARADEERREVERAADKEARRVAREDEERRKIERAADKEARRVAREDEERRKIEQATNTKRHRVAREDTERRKAEQAANTEARRIAREDEERRKVERAADKEAHRVARKDEERRKAERAADKEARRVAREDEQRRKIEQATNTKRHRVAREDTERRKTEQAANTEARRIAREDEERRKVERAADKEARRVARADEERRKVERLADKEARRVARTDEERRKVERAADKEARRVSRQNEESRKKEQAKNTTSRGQKRKLVETKTLENESRKRIRVEKTKKDRSEYTNLLNSFQKRISCGPCFICSCCGGLWYESSTTKTSRENLLLRGCEETFIDTVLHVEQDVHRLCSTCKNSVYKNCIPRLCLSNGFDFPEIPDELKDLSPLEERLVALRLPFMQIRLVGSEKQSLLRGNVVNVENDLNVCAAVLPRRFDDTSTIQVKLMRKMNYTAPYMYETIRPLKVYQAAKYLIDSEVYKSENVVLCDDWSRYEKGDVFEYDLNAPDPEDREDDEEEITDPGVGETLVFSEKQDASDFIGLRIAPAEGNIPIALYRDQNAEVMSFPTIYCGCERKFKDGIKISYTDIAKSELRRYDRRCCVPSKVLYSFKRSFNEKVMSAIQICLRKTTGNETLTAGSVLKLESVRNLLESDDGYAVFKHLRSSPSYWKEQTKKVLAMVRQLGKPALFITLSAAETKWIELIGMLHRIKTKSELTEEDIEALPFDKVAKLIREDPVTCMRHFEHRLRALQNLLLKPEGGIFAPYRLKDHFDRGEFQVRGSPHDHGLYWIENAPVYDEDDEDGARECEQFIDHLITCERNETGRMDTLIGYQLHKHSHTCTKRTRKCRFGFPKPPLDRTRILTPLPRDYDPRLRKNAEEILSKVKDACEKFGRHFKEIIPFETFLESLDVEYDDYCLALRTSIKRTTVFLKRSTNAVFINAYNTKLLEAWGANIDIQFVIDTYACAKYCVGYILKGEGGVSKLLQTLTQDVKRGNFTAREQVKKFANILINGSEISAQEATGFLLGMPNTHSTRQDIFINTAHPDDRICMLKPSEELINLDEGSQDIRVKGLIDHYIVRPEELEDISLAEFASMFEYSKTSTSCKIGEEDDARAIGRKNKSQRFKLLDQSGYIRKRTVRKVIRYRHFGKKEDPQNYWREQLMLFIPWRNEETELIYIDSIAKAKQCYNSILENSKPFIFDRDVDDNFLNDLMHEFDEDGLQLGDPETLVEDDEADLDQEGLTYNEEFNELDTSRSKVDQFLPPKLIDETQYLNIMRSLNEKQRRFVLHTLHLLKTNCSPFYTFLSGGAGVGKSHVITATVQSYLRFFCKMPTTNPESICVLVFAPTGKAAFNVFGMTLHCTFKLPPTQYGGRVSNLDDGPVNTLRVKLEKTKLFIIDEISMVSVKQLYDIDQRLRQIFATTQEFGGKSLLVVGHLRQLPPIGGSYVFKPQANIPLGELVGNHLWEKFSLYELDEIMRQRGELEFCKALNNMSEGIMDDEDVELIKSRQVGEFVQPPKEAIRLFQTNNECSIFNTEIHQELGTDGAISVAYDKIQGAGTDLQKRQLKEYAKTLDRQKADGLPYETPLQVGGEYFVSTNIDVQDGLFNGSTGSLKLIEYGSTADTRVPIRAWMDFRHPLIGIQKKKTSRSYQQQKRINLDWVGIDRITRNLSKTQRHGALEIIRKQIPLIAANGMTIAKSQGSTLTSVVVHVNKYNGKGSNLLTTKGRQRKLTRENLYVACSRSTTLNGLFIEGDFVPPTKPGPEDPVSLEMNRLRSIPFNFSIKFLQDFDDTYEKVYFHNVQSFIAHSPDVIADNCCLASNLICLVEPHVLNGDSFEIPNFECINRLNCRTHRNSEGALIFQKGHIRNHSCTSKQYYSGASHCLFVMLTVSSVNLIMTYKSPKYSSSLFLQKLSEILTALQMKTILFGDININLQSHEGKPIVEMLSKFGMTSRLNVHDPSTDGGTHIDCCYSNFLEMNAWFYECYYSYHKAICIIWPSV